MGPLKIVRKLRHCAQIKFFGASPTLTAPFSAVNIPNHIHHGSPNLYFYPEHMHRFHNIHVLRALSFSFNMIPLTPEDESWTKAWALSRVPGLKSCEHAQDTACMKQTRDLFLHHLGGAWVDVGFHNPPFLLRKGSEGFVDVVERLQIEHDTASIHTSASETLLCIVSAQYATRALFEPSYADAEKFRY